jgi:acyl-CoA thioesterase FadM
LATGYGVFKDDECFATSECVNVFYDMATRKTAVPSHSTRAALVAEMQS